MDYLQRELEMGHEVAMPLITGEEQAIELPPRVIEANFINTGELEDTKLIRTGMVGTMVKRRIKLERDVKKGFATITSQCSEGVRSKLEVSDTNQGMYNLVQLVKTSIHSTKRTSHS